MYIQVPIGKNGEESWEDNYIKLRIPRLCALFGDTTTDNRGLNNEVFGLVQAHTFSLS